jgi:type IV secretion system protein VirB10
MHDRLSPAVSPGGFRTGTRRVNNMPLILTGVALAGFLVIMAMVAVDRARRKAEGDDQKAKAGNASLFASSLTSKFHSGIIPAKSPPVPPAVKPEDKPPLVVPVAHVDLDHPPLPPRLAPETPAKDPELERIRQIKQASFEDAVKSATSGPAGAFSNPLTAGSEDASNPSASAGERGRAATRREAKTAAADRWRLDSRPEPPETRFVLRTGFVIPSVMISGINSQLPGPVIAQVSQPVYDAATGRNLLIPQGTRLFGTYSNEVEYGQERVFIAWQRLIFPDGTAMDLGEMPGTDGAGLAGLTGEVNNHYVRIFGNALLMSLITAGAAYSQQPHNAAAPQGFGYQQSASGSLSAALGQQLGTAGSALLMKNLNVAPTIEVHAGYRLNVVATKDLTFDGPYRPFAK